MKVLLTTPAGTGHLHPMVPLAQSLLSRGHSVLWALPDRGVAQVEQAGFRAVGTSALPPVRPQDVVQRYPELRGLAPAEAPLLLFSKVFGAVLAPAMLAGLAPVAQQWGPDLVVSDAAELAGPIVAAELGVPFVSKGFGPLLEERRVARVDAEVAPLWRARGLEPRPYGGLYELLYLDPFPPQLQPQVASHVPHRQLLRPVSYTGATAAKEDLPLPLDRRDRPLVYLTMGTVFSDAAVLRDLVGSLAQLDVRVLVTVGPQGDPAALGPQPEHVRVERYVPQAALLPHCDVVVSHAGSGTTLSALEHGLPQLSLPQGADQFLNAEVVASSGAGLSLEPGEVTGEAVSAAVGRLLEDGSFRDAAAEVSDTIAVMPSPDEVSAILEALV